ncbi:unnamed protein product, partial [Mesorhabditis belari]|uniref:Uncharacterized protein n=1 Tax=Mesorhabditis belari TaxID=2138241 RepID=A0AAF3EZD5_9BILA
MHRGHPKGPYYVQNETVHFARKHKADDGLEFNRDEIKFEPAKIVPAHELLEKMKQRKIEVEVHPDDRKQDDDYVNEKQDPDEKDYKQH